MPTEAGHGSPVGLDEADAGHGSPVLEVIGDTGYGSPIVFFGDGPQLPMVLRRAFQSDGHFATHGFDPAYSEDGGELVEVQAAWPTRGPLRAQLRDAAGALYPGESEGCYGAVPGRSDVLETNASQQFLRFALPRLRRGTYALIVTWEGGSTTKDAALRVVPRSVSRATYTLLRAPVLGTWMERRS